MRHALVGRANIAARVMGAHIIAAKLAPFTPLFVEVSSFFPRHQCHPPLRWQVQTVAEGTAFSDWRTAFVAQHVDKFSYEVPRNMSVVIEVSHKRCCQLSIMYGAAPPLS